MGKNGQDDTGTTREFVARRGATGLRRAGKAVETVIPDLERVIRLGVTGLSRAGKTVFITSLVAGLKNSKNMVELVTAHEGRLKAANLEPHPEGAIPHFPFEDHLRTILKQLKRINTEAKLNEEDAQSLVRVFTVYLKALKTDGYSRCTPGRFLQPGDLENAAILTFAPPYSCDKADKESLYKEFESRFEAYKSR